jgi:hypothetical protein
MRRNVSIQARIDRGDPVKKLQAEDVQMLSRMVQISYLRQQHLAEADRLAKVLAELREQCDPQVGLTADRVTLMDSTSVRRVAQCSAREHV